MEKYRIYYLCIFTPLLLLYSVSIFKLFISFVMVYFIILFYWIGSYSISILFILIYLYLYLLYLLGVFVDFLSFFSI